MRSISRPTEGLVAHRLAAIGLILALLLLVSGGIAFLEVESSFEEVSVGTDAEAALDRIEADFATGEDERYAQLLVEADNVLDRSTLIATLELQQAIRDHESIAPTLAAERPTAGLVNLIATAAAGGDHETATLSLDDQLAILESMSQADIDATREELLASDHGGDLRQFLPTDYDGGSSAGTTMIVVTHPVDPDLSSGSAPAAVTDAQLAMQSVAEADGLEVTVVGGGLLTAEMDQSTGDTLAVLGPVALVLVLLVLTLAYARLLDILLSAVGIVLVLLWTFGVLGWLGIPFNPILIAIPVFLIGMAIDFGIHVIMRYREHLAASDGGRPDAMAASLAGVGVALLWITVTTVTGFLSNLVSPMQPVRELGLMAAIGIVGAFVVFVGLIPALKVELETRLDGPTDSHPPRAVGTGGGRIGRLLAAGGRVVSAAPIAVVILVILVTAAATATAVGVDTSFDHEDTVPRDTPEWASVLPEPLAPGEYTVRDGLATLDERFLREGVHGEVLIEGDVTDPAVLQRLDAVLADTSDLDSVVHRAGDEPVATGPLTAMAAIAEDHPSFRQQLAEADTTGDGLPDRGLAELYDAMLALDPDRAERVVHRGDDGEDALRVTVAVDGAVDGSTVTEELDGVAAAVETDGTTATATGLPITHHLIDQHIIQTVVVSLFVTLLVVGILLAGVFRTAHGSAALGLLTLVPVTLAVAWIIATIELLGYSLDIVSALTASLTIGIGIDYSIHVSERFKTELDQGLSTGDALDRTLRGTGGALVGSAATTMIGFGTLALAFNPMLQQFGVITAIMIGYAFIGAVVVLPSLLVLWAKLTCADSTLACATGTDARQSAAD